MEINVQKNEFFSLAQLPVKALTLRLPQPPIRMQHDESWIVDKLNAYHDLIVCLGGKGVYEFESKKVTLEPGDVLLIPAFTRFYGRHGGGSESYTCLAQHFSLELFSDGDMIDQLELECSVTLPRWESLAPLVNLYCDTNTSNTTSLTQHHQFMVILLAYLDEAFISWKKDVSRPPTQDRISIQIAKVAAWLSSDPLVDIEQKVLSEIPYNSDYFRRVFRDRMGMTPLKFRERKRMEFAIQRLSTGLTVKEVASELGYTDPHYFSRQFKRHIGRSPSSYRWRKGQ